MSGEAKKRKTTKNNVRPSSCDRNEAELLSKTINEDSCLVSASDIEFPESFPTFSATTSDKGLSPEYTASFKKLNEEDPKTKPKPSSCDRNEAELLSKTINEDSCLVSASDIEFPESFPTFSATTSDKGLSPEYTASFKKLNEEGPKTKPKATRIAACSTHRVVMMRSELTAHARDRAFCEQIVRDSCACLVLADSITNSYYKHEQLMLFKTDLSVAPLSEIVSNAAIVEFLEEAVRTHGLELPAHQWDFTVVTLCSLVNSLRLTSRRWNCCKVAIITRAVLTLLGSVNEFMSTVYKHQPSAHVLALPAQWADDIEPYLTRHIVELIMVVLEPEDGLMTSCRMETIDALIASLTHLRHTAVSGAPSLRVVCAHAATALRRNTHPAYKYLAVAVLDFVTEALVLDDTEKLAAYCSRENVTPRPEFSLNYFDDAMMHLQEQVDAALSGVEVCEATRELLPGSDGHSAALGLLLLAAHLLQQCAHARGDLAQLYAELLSEGKHVGGLMASTMRLLPHDMLDDTLESVIYRVPTYYWSAFEDMPPLDVYRWCDAGTVGDLACFVLCETLGGLAMSEARDWAYALSTNASTTLRRIVRIVVAPLLQRRLLNQLCESAHELTDIKLNFEWSCAIVHCELKLEERILKMRVVLEDEHPLEPLMFSSLLLLEPDINSIELYLTHQNGTLVNAVKMCFDAIIAHVQSSPHCVICFDRVHSFYGDLPLEPCPQCHNIFHILCILKWFHTSGKSNCPLCRMKFQLSIFRRYQ